MFALLSINGNISIFLKTPKNRHHFLNMLKLEMSLMYFGITHNKGTFFLKRHVFRFIELIQKYALAYISKEELDMIYSLQTANPIDNFSKDTDIQQQKLKTIAAIIEYLRSL
jgi:hypothetical protein